MKKPDLGFESGLDEVSWYAVGDDPTLNPIRHWAMNPTRPQSEEVRWMHTYLWHRTPIAERLWLLPFAEKYRGYAKV